MPRQSRRQFSPAQKARVLEYYRQHGHSATLARYKLSSGVLHHWKQEAGNDPEENDTVPPVELAQTRQAIVYLEKAARIGLTDMEKGRHIRARIMLSMVLLALSALKGEDSS